MTACARLAAVLAPLFAAPAALAHDAAAAGGGAGVLLLLLGAAVVAALGLRRRQSGAHMSGKPTL